MRFFFPVAAALLLTACSDTPVATKAKEPAKPLEPITGRQAFQSTYPSARGWAADAQPFRIRSMNLSSSAKPKNDGTADLWEITYVSPSRSAARVFTWSSTEDANLHQGVFGGQQQSWRPGGQEQPFTPAHIKTDTPEALMKAVEESETYLKKPGQKPPVTFLLEYTPRFPDPVWRVLWGQNVGTSERQVFVDATTGTVVGSQ